MVLLTLDNNLHIKEEFWEHYKEENLTDCEIIIKNNTVKLMAKFIFQHLLLIFEQIRCHRNILSAVSPYFEVRFPKI